MTHTIYYYKDGPQKLRTNTPVESKEYLRNELGIKRIVRVCKNKQIPTVRYDVKVFRGNILQSALPWKEAKELFLSLREKNPASKYCIVVAK
jgi:hypothetical protein